MSNDPIATLVAPKRCPFAYSLEDHGLGNNLALDSPDEFIHMLLHRLGGGGSTSLLPLDGHASRYLPKREFEIHPVSGSSGRPPFVIKIS